MGFVHSKEENIVGKGEMLVTSISPFHTVFSDGLPLRVVLTLHQKTRFYTSKLEAFADDNLTWLHHNVLYPFQSKF